MGTTSSLGDMLSLVKSGPMDISMDPADLRSKRAIP